MVGRALMTRVTKAVYKQAFESIFNLVEELFKHFKPEETDIWVVDSSDTNTHGENVGTVICN